MRVSAKRMAVLREHIRAESEHDMDALLGGITPGCFNDVVGAPNDHLYVAPGWPGLGFGSALVAKAQTLSPRRLVLWTVQRNDRARKFYEAHGFRSVAQTEGKMRNTSQTCNTNGGMLHDLLSRDQPHVRIITTAVNKAVGEFRDLMPAILEPQG
jgi:hypothetical protein